MLLLCCVDTACISSFKYCGGGSGTKNRAPGRPVLMHVIGNRERPCSKFNIQASKTDEVKDIKMSSLIEFQIARLF